ncbi:hypothetical protein D3C76_1684690 [compost metagenome]
MVRPPWYSGMLPSALPAFSAPTAVRVVPSFAATSGDTAAWATLVKATERLAASSVLTNFIGILLRSGSGSIRRSF